MKKAKGLREIKTRTLAEGETTGHAHRVMVAVMEREDGVRVFNGATVVTHEEHNAITLIDGQWASDRKLETDHLTKMTRRVQD